MFHRILRSVSNRFTEFMCSPKARVPNRTVATSECQNKGTFYFPFSGLSIL